jgi:hypothetical protein
MTRPTVEDDKLAFLKRLAKLGRSSGNVRLRSELKWTEERYWRTHSILLDEGSIVRGRGKGGSVTLIQIVNAPANEEIAVAPVAGPAPENQGIRELDLYEPMKGAIETGWTKERGFDESVVEITGLPGRRNTGGTWTRPDLAVLAVKAYPYLPGRIFDIITFEAKKADAINVLGVFEALSHQQFASMSYVIFFTAGESFEDDYADTDRILALAKLHGVGVIVATDASDYKQWEELVEPRRSIPDPEQANLFIATCFSEDTKARVVKWHK